MRPRPSSKIQSLIPGKAVRFLAFQAFAIFVSTFPLAIAYGQEQPAWSSPTLQNDSDGLRTIDAGNSRTSPPVRSASAQAPAVRPSRSENVGPDNIWGNSLQAVPEQLSIPSAEQQSVEPFRTPERAAATGNLRQASVAVTNVAQSHMVPPAYNQAKEGNESVTTYGNTGLALDRPQAPDSSKLRSSSGTFQMLLSVGSSLLIVIGLFLGMAWAYKKTMNTSLSGMPKEAVKVLGRTGIAPRQSLMLIRFGPKLVLVSMVQGEMRTISEIDDPLQVDQIAGLCESCQPGSITNSFRNLLATKGETP